MRKYITGFCVAAALLLGATALATLPPGSPVQEAPEGLRENLDRACFFPIGGWTIVNCSNVAAATSGQLNKWSRYVLQCTDDSYLAWGDEATDVADTNDGYLAEGAWLEFITSPTVRYVSCLNINSDADCRYIECL